ncbi:MAG: WecB/TagA/CpsF family glycosyltransferase [Oscillospiraceae bacterium]|nr:WecB/TagA/CpsF family glycosyltransferase [Oscillospiraceae bacterium]
MRIDILGVGFDNLTSGQAVSWADGIIKSGGKSYIVTPNPEIVTIARRDESLRAILNSAGLVLPDGVGITIAARILGTPLCERIPGIDFASELLAGLSASSGSVFLLGAKPGVAEEAAKRLAQTYPELVVSGTADGYFQEDEPVIRMLNEARPDLLLVCLGAPKQEFWIAKNIEALDVRLCIGLGGALDVYAGAVKRAPAAFRKLGLEWLYRLAREPSRIKRMIKLPLFVMAAIMKRIRGIWQKGN